jgi:hypothetical protein
MQQLVLWLIQKVEEWAWAFSFSILGFQLLYNVVIMASAFVHMRVFILSQRIFCPADILYKSPRL